ncbi:DUF805 domain-containing protein [Halocynthiibacter sp. C4]|uniref:DUF805 domain-containing protein n=1 Tax=Halocynthiibacter sp. C4 TaxID=2992758 RepID=UPI00237BAF4A|nr:DUF805 domain-containing protein [Halocynthiibacter sp. C4]MDE0590389.1 DUF805 domain-containing protein [Halocynthiibacter sp. C4]
MTDTAAPQRKLGAIFAGRSGRKSYWRVVGPILLAMGAALAFGLLVLGPEIYEETTTSKSLLTGEISVEVRQVTDYGPRLASSIVGWLCVLPLLVMLTRRVHDIGYPSYFAWIAVFCAFLAPTIAATLSSLVAYASIPLALIVGLLTGLPATILSAVALLIIFLWGFAPSEPGENEYGPCPVEADQ